MAEEKNTHTENLYHHLTKDAPDAVIVFDRHNRILLWNQKAEKMFGWKEEEILGKSFAETLISSQYHDWHLLSMNGSSKPENETTLLEKTLEVIAINSKGKKFDI